MKKITFGLIVLTALLSGCESMSPSECATANWRERGVQDGNRGQSDNIAAYHESCAKAGIAADAASYRAGRTQGLQSYCRLDNAIKEGLAGRDYEDVCPAPGGQNFKTLHAAAYREQEARKKLEQLQNDQKQWEQELFNDKTPAKRKSTLRDQISRSDRHIYDARDELRSAQYRLERLRYDLRQGLY
jgi:hypothetical protein